MMGFKMQAIVIGIIATAALDLWSLLLNRFANIPMANWGMVGRWFAHMLRGRFRHDSIAAAEPVPNEVAIGWLAHYLIGILFAAVLLALWPGWIRNPTLWPPMIVGWVTILAGWLLLSPGLGGGIAHAKRPDSARARVLNIAGHTVFGIGLWAGGLLLSP